MSRADKTTDVRSLPDLVARMRAEPRLAQVLDALRRGESGTIDGAWGSACALAAAALVEWGEARDDGRRKQRSEVRGRKSASRGPDASDSASSHAAQGATLLVVLPRISEVDDFAVDLMSFAGAAPVVFPAWETLPSEQIVGDQIFGARLKVLSQLESDAPPPVVVASLPALLQPVPSREERTAATRTLRVGERLDLEALLKWLVERGFQRESALERPGEFSVHGGILDVFPPDAEDPLRIELFGDEVESIRTFDVETQRKVDDLPEARLTVLGASSVERRESSVNQSIDIDQDLQVPSSQTASAVPPSTLNAHRSTTHLADLLPDRTHVALVELPELIEEGRQYLSRLDNPRGLYSVESTLQRLTQRPSVTISALTADSLETTCHLQVESIERFTGPKGEVIAELASVVGQDERVLIACHNEAERERLGELLHGAGGGGGAGLAQGTEGRRDGGTEGQGDGETGRQGDRGTASDSVVAAHSISRSLRPSVPPTSQPAVPQPPAHHADLAARVTLTLGTVTRGFRIVSQKLVVLSDHELFSRTEVRRTPGRRKRPDSRAIDSFLDLNPGDYVVHLTHGIARYRGMELLDREGGKEEHLTLEFRDGVRIFVPVTLIHLVQKYVGAAKSAPTLSKVGGTQWGRQKSKVSEAVADMASDMLRLQAERETKPGLACPPDSHWQEEFERSFPYVETDDQVTAIEASKQDQMRPRPMDRLICGDVGFGKTEVAMRAAFKAVDAGRQVAVLVPTTVLCEQHYRTFSDRMAEFPVTIESLSRFKTKGEQNEILRRTAEGKVDILIGTHRLVQPDVRFKELGLLVIDEEQRFGVDAKEMLKRLRLAVDVLTLSATPIPRTLHMSLLGIRDISNLTTPPQDRQAIETRICRWDGELIRHAVVRELNRGGQVYFVHNRVYNIEEVRDRLQRIVPEARIIIGHGQMADHELERAMLTFVRGQADILVATTIIESGLDIPTANTMFIHEAQHYGLADLHQLRGRVGRHKHRAYCYLLLDEKKPVSSVAAKRLKAIEEYSELGAGFKIAMRDLEIRGAGNILGTEQSGHITTVGYELYCQLLESAVRRLQGLPQRESPHVNIELPFEAYLPNSYVPPGRQKIDVYRKVSATNSLEELEEVTAELRDRFGQIPPLVENLLRLRELEIVAFQWGLDGLRLESNPYSETLPGGSAPAGKPVLSTGGTRPVYAAMTYRDDQRIHDLAAHIAARAKARGEDKQSPLASLRIVDRRNAYLLLPRRELTGSEVVQALRDVLDSQPARGTGGAATGAVRSAMSGSATCLDDAGAKSARSVSSEDALPAGQSVPHTGGSAGEEPRESPSAKPVRPPKHRQRPQRNEVPALTDADLQQAGEGKLRGLLRSRRRGDS